MVATQHRIPQAFLDELLARVDIVDVIGKRVQLKKKGANHTACCPFHNEKTPSFTVSATKQFYYCFGCEAHGTAIGFLMEYDRLDFLDVVEMLAAQAGLSVPSSQKERAQQSASAPLYQALKKAATFYQKHLHQNASAQAYLAQRRLTAETLTRYEVGYAPEGWRHLPNTPHLFQAGMLIKKERGTPYDRFRHRIMFPIHDTRGRVIAFGGRTLTDEIPKYLNSPETPVFHKGHELYGLYQARQSCKNLEQALIVEGYMDVLSLFEHGIPYAVATLGTATSAKHLQRLFRYTETIIFCFDGDPAGQKAAWRALTVTLPLMRDGLQIKFIFLPEGDDPDTLIQREGKAGFIDCINQALSLEKFFFKHLTEGIDMSSSEGKSYLAQAARTHLSTLPQGVYKQLLFDRLAELIGISGERLESFAAPASPTPAPLAPKPQPSSNKLKPLSAVQMATSLLIQQPKLAHCATDTDFLLESKTKGSQLLHALLDQAKRSSTPTTASLLELWHDKPNPLKYFAKLATHTHPFPEEGYEKEFTDAIHRISEQTRKQFVQELINKAKTGSLSNDEKLTLQDLIGGKFGYTYNENQ